MYVTEWHRFASVFFVRKTTPLLGLRTNTREQRLWDTWDSERREVVQETLNCDPLYKPPHSHRPLVKELRLYIPAKENPGYNFIGLIIGPRGNTQKRLQQETGARIVVRGKGSEKEGAKSKFTEGQDDDLHVHICADTIEKVDKAARLVHPLLTPLDAETCTSSASCASWRRSTAPSKTSASCRRCS